MIVILPKDKPIEIGLPVNLASEYYIAFTKALRKAVSLSNLEQDFETSDILISLLDACALKPEQLQLGALSPS